MKTYAEWTFVLSMLFMTIAAVLLWLLPDTFRISLSIAINLLAIIHFISLIMVVKKDKEKTNE